MASSEAALLIQAAEYITRDTLLATVIGLNLDIKTQPASVIPPHQHVFLFFLSHDAED